MAKGFVGIQVTGFDKVLSHYKSIPKRLVDDVDAELGEAALKMVRGAVNDAPVDMGRLRNGITSAKRKQMDYIVVSDAEQSAFIEFGTKTRVRVPTELQTIAAQFKGVKTGGKNARQMIYDWCKRKGIEKKLWWPIFISIMTKGIHPHPFFYKNFFAIQPQTIKAIESAFKRALK